MKRTVLITGTSSGIGKETALFFHEKGWNVVATMRNPQNRHTDLHGVEGIDLIHLDVTDLQSIRDAIRYVTEKYKEVDVVVSNAGYALVGPVEAFTREQMERQFNTNVIGLMEVLREIIPVLRKQKHGVVVNLASIGGRIGFPFYSIYNSTKWAVEGFCEAVQYELEPFGIKIRIVEPGLIKTDFYDRSMEIAKKDGLDDYDVLMKNAMTNMGSDSKTWSHPKVVARTIFRAAVDKSRRLRYHTGKNASLLLVLRRLLPESVFIGLMRKMIMK